MPLAVVRTIPEVPSRPDLDTTTYATKFVEFWRMRGQKYNPQKRVDHNRAQLKELKASVAEFGFVDAPVLTSDFEIIDGHRRRDPRRRARRVRPRRPRGPCGTRATSRPSPQDGTS